MKFAFAGFAHVHSLDVLDMAIQQQHEVVGVWDPDEKSSQILEENGIKAQYDSYETMLINSNADIIAVGSCFGERGKMIIQAMQAGKHVIVDKPICTSFSELEEIRHLVRTKGLKLGCMLTMRYSGKAQAIRALIQNDAIGEVRTIYYGMQHPLFYGKRPNWYFEKDKYGGVINDIAVHGIDLIRYLTGLRPQKVLAARCWNAFATEQPNFRDCGQYMVELSNGAGLLADVSYSTPDAAGYAYPAHWEIFGSRGAIRFSLQNRPTEVYYADQKNPTIIEDSKVNTDFLKDFVTEITTEEKGILCTDDILQSTEDTLMIQKFADRY